MAVNANKASNSPIPKEAIEGAAGINDKFSVSGVDAKTCFEEKGNKTVPVMKVSGNCKREILSTDLTEGLSIKAVDTPTKESDITK